MLSKVKDLITVSKKLGELSKAIGEVSKEVSSQSKELSGFREEMSGFRKEIKTIGSDAAKFSDSVQSQIGKLGLATDDLKKEVYEFKLIKADIKSRLVAELADDFRDELKKEMRKVDVDVKRFNELKEELSRLVGKFKAVEGEIAKFQSIAQGIKTADFELARHAKNLAQADNEKLNLMQKIDHLERLVSKMRRGRHS